MLASGFGLAEWIPTVDRSFTLGSRTHEEGAVDLPPPRHAGHLVAVREPRLRRAGGGAGTGPITRPDPREFRHHRRDGPTGCGARRRSPSMSTPRPPASSPRGRRAGLRTLVRHLRTSVRAVALLALVVACAPSASGSGRTGAHCGYRGEAGWAHAPPVVPSHCLVGRLTAMFVSWSSSCSQHRRWLPRRAPRLLPACSPTGAFGRSRVPARCPHSGGSSCALRCQLTWTAPNTTRAITPSRVRPASIWIVVTARADCETAVMSPNPTVVNTVTV